MVLLSRKMPRLLSFFLLLCFTFNPFSPYLTQAQTTVLPQPNQLLAVSSPYSSPMLKGVRFNPADPLKLEFIIDTADQGRVDKEEAAKLVKYFLAGLTLPENDLWVNLSPYEANRIVPEVLSQTDLGKDLLGEDYILKQLASSLTYPETELGKKYWDEINNYNRSLSEPRPSIHPANGRDTQGAARIETTQSFNRVWIMPDKATIYENKNTAFITESSMKVMTEEDYLAGRFDTSRSLSAKRIETNGTLSDRATDAFKTHILPAITQEVNQGQNFATLRQIYNALMLAVWFKEKFKQSFYKSYIDQKKISGIDLSDKTAKEKIYNLYVEAFKNGAYNYVKRETTWSRGQAGTGTGSPAFRRGSVYVPGTGKVTRRQYFSGGVLPVAHAQTTDKLPPGALTGGQSMVLDVDLADDTHLAELERFKEELRPAIEEAYARKKRSYDLEDYLPRIYLSLKNLSRASVEGRVSLIVYIMGIVDAIGKDKLPVSIPDERQVLLDVDQPGAVHVSSGSMQAQPIRGSHIQSASGIVRTSPIQLPPVRESLAQRAAKSVGGGLSGAIGIGGVGVGVGLLLIGIMELNQYGIDSGDNLSTGIARGATGLLLAAGAYALVRANRALSRELKGNFQRSVSGTGAGSVSSSGSDSPENIIPAGNGGNSGPSLTGGYRDPLLIKDGDTPVEGGEFDDNHGDNNDDGGNENIGKFKKFEIKSIIKSNPGSSRVTMLAKVIRYGQAHEETIVLHGEEPDVAYLAYYAQTGIDAIDRQLAVAFKQLRRFIVITDESGAGLGGKAFQHNNKSIGIIENVILLDESIADDKIAQFHELAHLARLLELLKAEDLINAIPTSGKGEKAKSGRRAIKECYVQKLKEMGYAKPEDAPEDTRFHYAAYAFQQYRWPRGNEGLTAKAHNVGGIDFNKKSFKIKTNSQTENPADYAGVTSAAGGLRILDITMQAISSLQLRRMLVGQ